MRIRREVAIGAAALLVFVLLFALTERIPQDPAYHAFADTRTILSTPNFWNVFSNLPFLVVGLWGLSIVMPRSNELLGGQRASMLVLFSGVILTAFGSSYYHLAPDNATLFWDRLAMTIAFAGLFTTMLGLYVTPVASRKLLLPFVLLGGGSVLYWRVSEAAGAGDLRAYAIVQFLPMLAMLGLLSLRGDRSPLTPWLWATFALYVASKIFEHADAPLYAAIGLSGHALKHVAAALGVAAFALGLSRTLGKLTAER
ncbi:MAG: hypothetical protein QNJ00_02070 [Woeseiaceae bacterium]|nr:hypothetical protein [Woeseiaceae bacterium]